MQKMQKWQRVLVNCWFMSDAMYVRPIALHRGETAVLSLSILLCVYTQITHMTPSTPQNVKVM